MMKSGLEAGQTWDCNGSILRRLKSADLCPEFGPPSSKLWFSSYMTYVPRRSYMLFWICVFVHVLLLLLLLLLFFVWGVCLYTISSFVLNAKLFSVHFILRTFATIRTRQVLFSVQQVIYFLANN